jgi:hypothetical protein
MTSVSVGLATSKGQPTHSRARTSWLALYACTLHVQVHRQLHTLHAAHLLQQLCRHQLDALPMLVEQV